MRFRPLLLSIPFLMLAALQVAPAAAPTNATGVDEKIKKCQDQSGKWYYGDNAAEECAKSKVELFSEKGTKRKELEAPPTAAELADRQRRDEGREHERLALEEQKRRDQILLSTYGHEDDIGLVRDRKLAQIEATLKAGEETLKTYRGIYARLEVQKQSDEKQGDKKAIEQTDKAMSEAKAQIERHEKLMAQKREEQAKVRKQYEEELQRYRELRRSAPVTANPAAK